MLASFIVSAGTAQFAIYQAHMLAPPSNTYRSVTRGSLASNLPKTAHVLDSCT